MKAVVLLCLSLVAFVCAQSDPSYDHQTTTYNAQFHPQIVKNAALSITTYFSPDNSIETETYFIQNATTSLDIGCPGFDSWIGCSNGTSIGCPVSVVRNQEQFPIFQAALNAIYRGVKVRILTNNYNTPVTPGLIDPLDFLAAAGAQTRYYTSTTFLHTKYLAIDGNAASVSSVNFDYTSFMENREAGVIISGSGALPLVNYLDTVFTYDFNNGGQWPTPTYNASDMAIIDNTTPVSVVIPSPRHYSGAYVTSVNTVTSTFSQVSMIASPDYSWVTVSQALNATQSSLGIYAYQIFGGFCDIVQALDSAGVSLKILVSDRIYSYPDWKSAQACYETLYYAGITIRLTKKDGYTYSHQKYWIIDGQTVQLSTGNLSPTDYPEGSNSFPPYPSSSWRDANRDYTISMTNSDIVGIYQNVLDEDYERGEDYYPSSFSYFVDGMPPKFPSLAWNHY